MNSKQTAAAFSASDLRSLAVAAQLRAEACDDNDEPSARWWAVVAKCVAHEDREPKARPFTARQFQMLAVAVQLRAESCFDNDDPDAARWESLWTKVQSHR